MFTVIKITYWNTREKLQRKLAGLENSVRWPHAACEPVFEPHWYDLFLISRQVPKF